MSTFDEREQAFERKYALDEELRFKALARRNKLLGLWVAEKLGLSGTEAEAYAQGVVKADLQEAGNNDVLRKIENDFASAKKEFNKTEIARQLDAFTAQAVAQMKAGK